jgi:hypothetical protein
VVAVVIPERHEDVAGVPAHDDVLNLRVDRNPVEREVGLQEAPMGLRLDAIEHLVAGARAHVEPRRDLGHTPRKVAVREDQVRDDRLHPRGPRLVRGGDDHVALAGLVAVPAGALEVVVLVDAGGADQFAHAARDASSKRPRILPVSDREREAPGAGSPPGAAA